MSPKDALYRLSEAENLIRTYGGVVLVKKIQKKQVPNYKTYIGSGKIDEIIEENRGLGANIIIVNNELKPRQTYNIGELVRGHGLTVWDRIDLILKIFQKHATTKEARLEIELAGIRHMGPRIFGMGMELSRQAGGIGTRGVGETNIEFMRRHLKKMEEAIVKDLEKCKKVRELHRAGRRRRHLKTVGIIGYTNAGKTSLLNALTHKGALAADKLFSTLDTRVGKIYFENTGQQILVSDTIGFIQDLPTTLINSFRSTLEETIRADLLLHVIDISNPKMTDNIKTVRTILAQIDALAKPTIYVFNKIDLARSEEKSTVCKPGVNKSKSVLLKKYNKFSPCFVSASTGEGIPELKNLIQQTIG
ncbi:GTPase HflX [Patescibacteria group bacterium]|nr:GTPase HflX [Patescibacteria group bacterium]MBU1953365.1 GTPase HflX [Patescibacteria group bacterium]